MMKANVDTDNYVLNRFLMQQLVKQGLTVDVRDYQDRSLLTWYMIEETAIPTALFYHTRISKDEVLYASRMAGYDTVYTLLRMSEWKEDLCWAAQDHAVKYRKLYCVKLINDLRAVNKLGRVDLARILEEWYPCNGLPEYFVEPARTVDVLSALFDHDCCPVTMDDVKVLILNKVDVLTLQACVRNVDDLDGFGKEGSNLLQESLRHEATEFVRLLLRMGASPLVLLPAFHTPLDFWLRDDGRPLVREARRSLCLTAYLVLTPQRTLKKAPAVSISLDDLTTKARAVRPIRRRLIQYLLGPARPSLFK
jgi:hypothetical protein